MKPRISLTRVVLLCLAAFTFTACAVAPPTPESEIVWAARDGQLDEVKRLHTQGVSVSAESRGFSPLRLAAAWGHEDVVLYLIENGADLDAQRGPNMVNLGTYDAMLQATQSGHYRITEILAKAGADPTLTVKFTRSEYLGLGAKFADAVMAGEDNPGPYIMKIIETHSPWYQDGRYVRPSNEVLASARASVIPESTPVDETVVATPASKSADDDFARLRKLKELLDDGVITQEDFDRQKAMILNNGTDGQ